MYAIRSYYGIASELHPVAWLHAQGLCARQLAQIKVCPEVAEQAAVDSADDLHGRQ